MKADFSSWVQYKVCGAGMEAACLWAQHTWGTTFLLFLASYFLSLNLEFLFWKTELARK